MTSPDNTEAPASSEGFSDDDPAPQQITSRFDSIPRPDRTTGLMKPALWWAERGYAVIPLEPAGKRPIIKDWTHQASRDPHQIAEWWAWKPGANLGVVTGSVNRLLVVDVDVKADGVASWKSWAWDHDLALGALPYVLTPSGGYHFWFTTDQAVSNAVNLREIPGVDIRGDGGQVAAPPSVRIVSVQEHGYDPVRIYKEYELLHGRLDRLPAAPDALLRAVERGGYGSSSGRDSSSLSGEFPATDWFVENGFSPGQRNSDCHRLACRLWRNHWPYDDLVTSKIYAAWLNTPQEPDAFTWAEAMGCVRSARDFVVPKVAAEMAWAHEFGGSR